MIINWEITCSRYSKESDSDPKPRSEILTPNWGFQQERGHYFRDQTTASFVAPSATEDAAGGAVLGKKAC
jgi:hypothetical protein